MSSARTERSSQPKTSLDEPINVEKQAISLAAPLLELPLDWDLDGNLYQQIGMKVIL